jgi:catechol 2,3-dioxygenase-like lactoylglutathione lyase family enzyme
MTAGDDAPDPTPAPVSASPSALLACSHLVLASGDVPRITAFFRQAFDLTPHYENDLFVDFVLPSKFRIAFFKPVGASSRTFRAEADRDGSAFGLTVSDVEASHARLTALSSRFPFTLSGPPKEHPWGEKSFLLTDPDGNRWEIAQTPSADGMLVNR